MLQRQYHSKRAKLSWSKLFLSKISFSFVEREEEANETSKTVENKSFCWWYSKLIIYYYKKETFLSSAILTFLPCLSCPR
jgi:hypothetical protein